MFISCLDDLEVLHLQVKNPSILAPFLVKPPFVTILMLHYNKVSSSLLLSFNSLQVASNEKALIRPRNVEGKWAAQDGSYLNLPSYGSKGDRVGSVNCALPFLGGFCSDPVSLHLPCEKGSSGHDGCTIGARKCPEGTGSEPGPDTRSNREHLVNAAVGPNGATEPRVLCHDLGPRNTNRARVELSRTIPHFGGEDWVEKRQRLLLQKKQLELERERLQARLVQQEERLLKQNQELSQSRLDYSKYGKVIDKL